MTDLSEELRLPVGCPSCGSHLFRASQVHNPDDKVFCASCKRYLCLYSEAKELLRLGPGDEREALIEHVVNRPAK
ncbi:MAG: hypothetical protein ACQEUM_06620 [Pseudomonadota bacterium]